MLLALLSEPTLSDSLQPLLQDVVLAVIGLLGTVLTALLGWAGGSLKRWLESKAHGAAFACATEKLETLTKNAVLEVEQTLVKQLKADDKWNADTAVEARDAAVATAKTYLGDRGMKELKGCMGHAQETVEAMLRSYVEKHVNGLHSAN